MYIEVTLPARGGPGFADCVLALLCVRRVLGRKQFLTGAGESNYLGDPNVARVSRAKGFDGDRVARLQRIPRPPFPKEHIGTAHLESPIRNRTVVAFDIDVKPGVRILPLQFGDRARQLDRL